MSIAKTLLAASALVAVFLPSAALAVDGASVVSLAAADNGDFFAYFDLDLCDPNIVDAPKKGVAYGNASTNEKMFKVLLAAHLAGKTVNVDAEPYSNNKYCALKSVRIQ